MLQHIDQPEPQVQVMGQTNRFWICDRTGNEYDYDISEIVDAYIKLQDSGHSVIYLGFRTKTVVPVSTVQPVAEVIDDDEDPF